jgi:hypothetical protein
MSTATKITISYQNGQGEQSNCQTIATQFLNEKMDLILAIATHGRPGRRQCDQGDPDPGDGRHGSAGRQAGQHHSQPRRQCVRHVRPDARERAV